MKRIGLGLGLCQISKLPTGVVIEAIDANSTGCKNAWDFSVPGCLVMEVYSVIGGFLVPYGNL